MDLNKAFRNTGYQRCVYQNSQPQKLSCENVKQSQIQSVDQVMQTSLENRAFDIISQYYSHLDEATESLPQHIQQAHSTPR